MPCKTFHLNLRYRLSGKSGLLCLVYLLPTVVPIPHWVCPAVCCLSSALRISPLHWFTRSRATFSLSIEGCYYGHVVPGVGRNDYRWFFRVSRRPSKRACIALPLVPLVTILTISHLLIWIFHLLPPDWRTACFTFDHPRPAVFLIHRAFLVSYLAALLLLFMLILFVDP